MGFTTIEHNPVAETVAANKKFFWVCCLVGLLLVSAGIFSLRMDKTIPATGVVMAEEEQVVFAPVDGVLGQHLVQIGQTVDVGTPLFSLAGDDFDLRLLEKRRQLLEVEGELSAVKLALKRAEIRPGEQHVASRRTGVERVDAPVTAEGQEVDLLRLEQEGLQQQHDHLLQVQEVLKNEVEVLQRRRQSLDVVSPIAGTVIDIYKRDPGLAVSEGEAVLKIANTANGYRVKAHVTERNIDLLRDGSPVRMASQVFDSQFEGYVRGKVERILGEPNGAAQPDAEDPRYEVIIEVEETPYPLVLGSRMEIDFLLGRQTLLALIMNRPVDQRASLDAEEAE